MPRSRAATLPEPTSAEVPLKIDVRCTCGQVYHSDTAHAGRTIRCRCGRTVIVPAQSTPSPRPSGSAAPSRRHRFRLPRLRWPGLSTFRWPHITVSRRTSNILVLLAWGYLAATLLFAALLWLGGDRWWPATVLLFAPRWPVLFPGPLLALAVVFTRPRLLLPLAIGILAALGPVMGYRIGWRRWLAGSARPELRIVTFNIDAIDNPQITAIPLGLDSYHADIVVFQECTERMAEPENWPPRWTARYDDGFCLASRFPVVEAKTLERVRTGAQGGTGNVMLYRLRGDSGLIELAVVHLETPRKGLEPLRFGGSVASMQLNVLVRDVGSRRLRRWIAEQSPGPIIAGDFNMPVESVIYRTYWGDCPDAFSTVGHGFGDTRTLRWFSIRIDHVITCGPWRALRTQIGPDLGSDHLPLIVDLARRK